MPPRSSLPSTTSDHHHGPRVVENKQQAPRVKNITSRNNRHLASSSRRRKGTASTNGRTKVGNNGINTNGHDETYNYLLADNHDGDNVEHNEEKIVKSSSSGPLLETQENDININNTMGAYNSGSLLSSPYGSGFYGGGGGGMMMMPPPMYMGGSGNMGPLSGLYQVLYGVQNVVFSISQAVQLVGMNQQLLQQAWESLTQMVDHAIATFYEMRALEQHMKNSITREETEEEKQRRRRLKALRYALVFGGSWLAYKLVRMLLLKTKRSHGRRRLLETTNNPTAGLLNNNNSFYNSTSVGPYGMSTPPYNNTSYGPLGGYGGYSPYYGSSYPGF
eukprot:CAMPEP_0178746334 /NCGR_PEP_ID=MMETSP0744-20121128/7755_1 /TAXON_ID=913974 /ORGANISM="Nitzschia punctata, Strain CCMP561" /LENGTH=332 /DNA_ID=CAMNT_0020399541 /DNA_START=51 /DNA_END=1049 /DNA_ORIENTATION=-